MDSRSKRSFALLFLTFFIYSWATVFADDKIPLFVGKASNSNDFYKKNMQKPFYPKLAATEVKGRSSLSDNTGTQFPQPIEKHSIYNSDELICGVDSNRSYLEEGIRAGNRDVLLSSIDERVIKSCEMDIVEVKRRFLSKKIVLIDIRPPKEFGNYRISESINMPPFEIKSKTFLKNKHVVIVGNNDNIFDMGLLCHELKLQKFKKVNFIKGGIGSWEDNLIGRDASTEERWEFGRISTRKFVSLKSKIAWLVLDASADNEALYSWKSKLGNIRVVRFDINNSTNLNIVKNHMNLFEKKSLYGILAVSKTGEKYGEVDDFLRNNNVKNVYYLDGGIEAYEKYTAEREVFLSRLKRGPVKSYSCNSV